MDTPSPHTSSPRPAFSIPVVGLTGGIAAGKSTVARMFRELGAFVLDADELARAVVAPGSPALAAITTDFGAEVLDAAGALNRKRLAALVFEDAAARARLEAITHPAIAAAAAERIAEAAHAGATWALYEVALLVETGLNEELDSVVVVSADAPQQVSRSMQRDGAAEADVQARLSAQLPLSAKLAVADYVIDNTGDLQETRSQVRALYQRFQERYRR